MLSTFYSPAPVSMQAVPWEPDPTQAGCTMASLSYIRESPELRQYLPLLDPLQVPWDRYGVDIRNGYLRPNCYFGIPWWHADYHRPNSNAEEPMYYYIASKPTTAPLLYYTGEVKYGTHWSSLDADALDKEAQSLSEGRWHRFAPLTLHRASESRSGGARLFVRVRPVKKHKNQVEHSCMIYADIAKAQKTATW